MVTQSQSCLLHWTCLCQSPLPAPRAGMIFLPSPVTVGSHLFHTQPQLSPSYHTIMQHSEIRRSCGVRNRSRYEGLSTRSTVTTLFRTW